jgi:arylsulfatase
MSEDYEAFAGRTMVVHAEGKAIDYVGIDSKTGRYLAVDPATMKPVAAPQAIPVSRPLIHPAIVLPGDSREHIAF